MVWRIGVVNEAYAKFDMTREREREIVLMSGAKNENVNKNVRDECVMMCRKRVKEYRENLFRLLGDYTFDGSLICGNLGRNLDR